jgi:molecular chaperone DnaK (HSP70)
MYEAALSAYEEDRGSGSVDRLGAQAKQRLRLAVDQVKIDLSSEDSVTLSVDMGTAFVIVCCDLFAGLVLTCAF